MRTPCQNTRVPASKEIWFLTTYVWEGPYVLKRLLEDNVNVTRILVQAPWWGTPYHGFSPTYLQRLEDERIRPGHSRTRFTFDEVCGLTNIDITVVPNINELTETDLPPDGVVLVVVGSRIIRSPLINHLPNRIINFHTGSLPQYRGPYSEFWSLFNNDPGGSGSSIHLIDEGIDTGPIIAKTSCPVGWNMTPEELHSRNVKCGAALLAQVLKQLEDSDVLAISQDDSQAAYYSTPDEVLLNRMRTRLGRDFDMSFAE